MKTNILSTSVLVAAALVFMTPMPAKAVATTLPEVCCSFEIFCTHYKSVEKRVEKPRREQPRRRGSRGSSSPEYRTVYEWRAGAEEGRVDTGRSFPRTFSSVGGGGVENPSDVCKRVAKDTANLRSKSSNAARSAGPDEWKIECRPGQYRVWDCSDPKFRNFRPGPIESEPSTPTTPKRRGEPGSGTTTGSVFPIDGLSLEGLGD